jgi:hypothetical protein
VIVAIVRIMLKAKRHGSSSGAQWSRQAVPPKCKFDTTLVPYCVQIVKIMWALHTNASTTKDGEYVLLVRCLESGLRASSIHLLHNLTANLLRWDLWRDLGFEKTFVTDVDLMQICYPFTLFFFLQPCGCLSPLPCTKVAIPDGSKLKHLHPSGWSHCIFRIAFIMCTYKRFDNIWNQNHQILINFQIKKKTKTNAS